jgi:transcription elongation factor GreA
MSGDDMIVLTRAGKEQIEKELERLCTQERREVAERIRESKQFGEFSENAEYEDAKIAQAFVEGRIGDLRRVLQHARVLNDDEIPDTHVGLGSIVTIRDTRTNEDWEVQIVGSVEADPNEDRISDQSPVGLALMDHKVGDTVTVAVPNGKVQYRIINIRK